MKYKIYTEYTMFEQMEKTLKDIECQITENIYTYIIDKLKSVDYINIKYYLYDGKMTITKVFNENGLIKLESENGEIFSFYHLTLKQKVFLSYFV